MSQFAATNTDRSHRSQSAPGAKQNYLASDDVHRIAMRRPALYQTRRVPQVTRHVVFDDFGQEELS
jgi:hypothetical protein